MAESKASKTINQILTEFLEKKENQLTLPQVLERMPWFPQVPIRPKPASEVDLGPADGSKMSTLRNYDISQALLRLSGDKIFWVPPEEADGKDQQVTLGELEAFLYKPEHAANHALVKAWKAHHSDVGTVDTKTTWINGRLWVILRQADVNNQLDWWLPDGWGDGTDAMPVELSKSIWKRLWGVRLVRQRLWRPLPLTVFEEYVDHFFGHFEGDISSGIHYLRLEPPTGIATGDEQGPKMRLDCAQFLWMYNQVLQDKIAGVRPIKSTPMTITSAVSDITEFHTYQRHLKIADGLVPGDMEAPIVALLPMSAEVVAVGSTTRYEDDTWEIFFQTRNATNARLSTDLKDTRKIHFPSLFSLCLDCLHSL